MPSMGPRSHERGEDARNLKLHMKFHPSMGPRSHERGEPPRAATHPPTADSLQWGRAHMNAERLTNWILYAVSTAPSMGPRSHERGETPCPGNSDTPVHPSMGPRSHERGELKRWKPGQALRTFLQWGRAHMNAERKGTKPDVGVPIRPSMGPRSHERGEWPAQ